MSPTTLPTHEEATKAVKAGTATALDRFIYNNEPAGPTEEEFREGLATVLDEVRAKLSPVAALQPPIEAIQLVCDALIAIVAHSGDPTGTVNTLAQWRTRAETFIQNHGKPKEGERLTAEMALSQQLAARVDDLERQLAIAQQPTSAQPAAVPDGWRDAVGKAYHFMQDIGEHGVTCAIYDLDEDGKHIQCSCGMDETLRSLNALLATVPQPTQVEQQAQAVQFLLNGDRFKVSTIRGEAGIYGLPRSMNGQWVAFVDATDGKHLEAQQPPPAHAENPATSTIGTETIDFIHQEATTALNLFPVDEGSASLVRWKLTRIRDSVAVAKGGEA